MKRYAAIIALLTVMLTTASDVLAQYENEKDASIPLEYFYVKRQGPSGLRKILSKITFGLSTGYGNTTFKHSLDGFGVLQNPDSMPKLFRPASTASGYSNWINRVQSSGNTVQPGAFLANSDTTELGFKSKAFNIPIRATLHVEISRYKIRLGGGYSFEYTNVGDFKPTNYSDQISTYSSEVSSFFLKKYFLMVGAPVYRYNEYLLVVDANVGGYKLGSKFDNSVIKKGIYFNFGVAVEREMSEYFRLFVRPSYEIKGYKISMPESGPSISHKLNAFYINVGATYRIPELRRCFLKTCHAQMNHAHGNREYRSRRHPIYKKQNPHYGENYPNLIKYKGKNKKKLNPY
ncbi:hypothetical protein ACFQ21_28155 [Ohtaekwangia kribbensis]|uniref:Outer membrane protein beta-barrel domain-containing protein n=1 Tax=Ohtaekwangia kribbensis TaxID=688913 RepID=A0ABW3KB22_9BACT